MHVVIVGAGPTGLFLSWLFATYNKWDVTLIERESDIGGCHRVRRMTDNNSWTEHGPRIYVDNYYHLSWFLRQIGFTSFDKLFTPYKFTISDIGGQSLTSFSLREIAMLALYYILFSIPIISSWSKNKSIGWVTSSFSHEARDYIDRLCRLTDGGGIDTYTAWEFFHLFNQNILYTIHEPRAPNDQELFPIWRRALEQTGRVNILTDTTALRLQNNDNVLLKCHHASRGVFTISADDIILAIPPSHVEKIVHNTYPKDWLRDSTYFTYIPVSLHFEPGTKLPKQWGMPKTEWGVVFVNMSDYWTNDNDGVILSCAITRPDAISSHTGLTANQTGKKHDICDEVLRQLQLPTQPTNAIVSPGVYRNNHEWKTRDSAFFLSTKGYWPSFKTSIPHVWQCGPHNGVSEYAFTSMETAMASAMKLWRKMSPVRLHKYPDPGLNTMNKIVYGLIIIVILLLWI